MEKVNNSGEYYIGLDIGSDSVGWAVTDTEYRLQKFRGNAMWGVRLFDESNTAEDRRGFRASRRRTARIRERISRLEYLFDREITATDRTFFMRFHESSLYLDDRKSGSAYAVFDDDGYTDKEFHTQFPTIYHLRLALINDDPIVHEGDRYARFVYIALHHIIKHRGHFLFADMDVDQVTAFEPVWDELCEHLREYYEIDLRCTDTAALAEILKNRKVGKTKKNGEVFKLFGITKKEHKQIAAILSTLSGSTVQLSDIYDNDELKDAEKKSVTLTSGLDELEMGYAPILGDGYELLRLLKAVYDWALLADIMHGHEYISEAKTAVYEKHSADLVLLKDYTKNNMPEKYAEIFKTSKSGLANYVAYSGHMKKGVLEQTTTQEDFCAYLKKVLGKCADESYSSMFEDIENGVFMPKAVSKENATVPMQIHRKELDRILQLAQKYLPFLSETDEYGSVSDKVRSVFNYRIPFYVGPLLEKGDRSPNAWIVRSSDEITPWNFPTVVNLDASADAFIDNLTSKCTYLPAYDVLPKCSLLYSRFMVLNEINNIRLDGMPISVELKQRLFNEKFMTKKSVTMKVLRGFFDSMGYTGCVISGIDTKTGIKASMRTAIELSDYPLSDDEKEKLIRIITIIGDDKAQKKRRIKKEFGSKLTDEQISELARLKYSGWGNFSREFLTEVEGLIPDSETGETGSIMRALWETNYNLMEIIHTVAYTDAIQQKRGTGDTEKSMHKLLDEMYVSPKVKRPVYQAMQIVQEIVGCMGGRTPGKVFVEVPRFEGTKGDAGRTKSRKKQLEELYEKCKEYVSDELMRELAETDEQLITKRDKLYLYFTQFGKCMYTGERIVLSDMLRSSDIYDIDHIWPQSRLKDDSLDNRVLVKKTANGRKSDVYPIDAEIQGRMRKHWHMLHEKGLISDKKYERLTRTTPLTDDELNAFINRQLTETSQASKAVATLLTELYKGSTEIVWVKAGIVSDFRQRYDMLKCREVNDLHHAKDAYLNIVVGNVYNTLFNHKYRYASRLTSENDKFNFKYIFEYYDIGGAWELGDELRAIRRTGKAKYIEEHGTETWDEKWRIGTTMQIVMATMRKNNILYTRYAYCQSGGLFKQQPLKKGSGQVPLKAHGPLSDISKYGGYDKATSTYFAYVEYTEIKETKTKTTSKKVRALIPIDLHVVKEYEADPIRFLTERMGLTSPRVLIPCVKYNSCISIDGFRMHISRKTNKQIGYKPAMQLVVGYEWEKYLKEVVRLVKASNEIQNKNKKGESEESLFTLDLRLFDISRERNEELFDLLCQKMTETLLRVRFGDMGEKIAAGRDVFEALSEEEQCFVLEQILNILGCNAMSGDITLIGGAKNAGLVLTNFMLTEIKGVKRLELIHQSVTGLYEQRIDLLREPWDGEQ